MKKLIIVGFLMLSLSLVAQKKIDFEIIQTSAVCEMCENLIIKNTLAFEKGIKYAEMDLKTGALGVRFRNDKISLNRIRLLISQLGYSADSLKADPKAFEALHFCCKEKRE